METTTVKRNLDGTPHKVDVNKSLKEKKKQELIEIYAQETGLPHNLLENIYDFCEKTPDKKLKQIKKGQYKNKTFNPKRPVFKDGAIVRTASFRPLTEEEMKPVIVDSSNDNDYDVVEKKELNKIEEIV